MEVPQYILIMFLGLVIFLYGMILLGLFAASGKAGADKSKRIRSVIFAGAGMLIWLVLLTVLAKKGIFEMDGSIPPKVVLSIIPAIIAIVVFAFLKPVNKLLDTMPTWWMPGLQSFRIVMEIILFLLAKNAIAPKEMTFEGWNFDIVIGITALGIAFWLFKGGEVARKVGIAWNFFGMAVLSVVVGTGIGSALGLIELDPQNTFIGFFPFNLLPAFVVPVAFFMHVMSIKQLLRRGKIA